MSFSNTSTRTVLLGKWKPGQLQKPRMIFNPCESKYLQFPHLDQATLWPVFPQRKIKHGTWQDSWFHKYHHKTTPQSCTVDRFNICHLVPLGSNNKNKGCHIFFVFVDTDPKTDSKMNNLLMINSKGHQRTCYLTLFKFKEYTCVDALKGAVIHSNSIHASYPFCWEKKRSQSETVGIFQPIRVQGEGECRYFWGCYLWELLKERWREVFIFFWLFKHQQSFSRIAECTFNRLDLFFIMLVFLNEVHKMWTSTSGCVLVHSACSDEILSVSLGKSCSACSYGNLELYPFQERWHSTSEVTLRPRSRAKIPFKCHKEVSSGYLSNVRRCCTSSSWYFFAEQFAICFTLIAIINPGIGPDHRILCGSFMSVHCTRITSLSIMW